MSAPSAPASLRLSPTPQRASVMVEPMTSTFPPGHGHALVAGLAEPLVTGNRVTLLQDGPDTYAAMFEAIASARISRRVGTR